MVGLQSYLPYNSAIIMVTNEPNQSPISETWDDYISPSDTYKALAVVSAIWPVDYVWRPKGWVRDVTASVEAVNKLRDDLKNEMLNN